MAGNNMLLVPRRAFAQFPEFLPIVANKVTTMPSWMEWYRPAITATQSAVESIHAALGCPWWLSIALLTVGVRLTTVPFLLLQLKSFAPFAKAMPEFRLLKELHAKSQLSTKHLLLVRGGAEVARETQASFLKLVSYAVLQVPLFVTFVWSVRSLCATNESLKTGGLLWFSDLTVADPTFVLPLVCNCLTYYAIGKGITPENQDWLINRLRGVWQTFLIGVFCYWGTSAVYTLLQITLLRLPAVQHRVNKNLIEDMKVTFATNKTDAEAERVLHHLTTGQELSQGRPENEVLAGMQLYLKQQNKLKDKKNG